MGALVFLWSLSTVVCQNLPADICPGAHNPLWLAKIMNSCNEMQKWQLTANLKRDLTPSCLFGTDRHICSLEQVDNLCVLEELGRKGRVERCLMCWLLCCCCDSIHKQPREERVSGLWSQTWPGHMAWQQEQKTSQQYFTCLQVAEREQKVDWS